MSMEPGGCERCGCVHPDVSDDASRLRAIRQAIADYHYALDTRQHAGIAAHRAVDVVQCVLDCFWRRGEEKARRASIP